jgi:putative peptidoglycan lipid II flippase
MTAPKTASFVLHYLSWKECFKPRLFSLEIRQMLSSLSLGVLGVAATQINTAVDTLFARICSLEGPAYLNYAIHLQQLPLALFGIAVSSALLPPLSRAFQADDRVLSKTLLESAVSNALLFILPCTMGIFALGRVSVNLLFARGDFTALSAIHTTECLWGYGIGLTPMVLSLLFAPAYYAKKDYWTPTAISLCSIAMNCLLNVLFVFYFRLGPASLAFSTSFSALVNAAMLYRRLPFRTALFSSAWKPACCSFFAAGASILFDWMVFTNRSPDSFGEQLLQFFTLFTIFGGFFILGLKEEISGILGKKA